MVNQEKKMALQTIPLISDPQMELERKIDAITKFLSRPYFNTILKDLSKKNFENASIICNYIYSEQIELNIKNNAIEQHKQIIELNQKYNDLVNQKDSKKEIKEEEQRV